MPYECFELSVTKAVAHLQLSRPEELNTMTGAFWRELPEIVDELSDAGTVRAIVLSSTGRHFCAGLDISLFESPELRGDPEVETGRRRANVMVLARSLQSAIASLERARVPVLAAVQGGCIGGGLDLVSAADMRYATDDAWFSIAEINIGMTADVGSLQRLPKLIPDGVARELAFTGRKLSASRAREIGLVNDVYPSHDAMIEAVLHTAAEIASKSPLAIWGTKESINYARDHSVADGLAQIATWQAGMLQPADLAIALGARSDGTVARFDDLGRAPRGFKQPSGEQST